MKNKKPLLIVGLILLLTIILLLVLNKEQTFKIISFSNNNGVRNTAERSYLDTIAQVGLDKLELEGITILVEPLKKDMKIGDFDVEAYIVGNNKQYIIFMKPMSRDKSIEVMAHELIHLFQTERGQLQKRSDYIVWEGDTIKNPGELSYDERPWEKQAFIYGRALEKEIRKELIK
jgi:predicted metallopeptidase